MRLGYSTGYASAMAPFFCPRVVAFPGQQNLRTSGCIPPKRSRVPPPCCHRCVRDQGRNIGAGEETGRCASKLANHDASKIANHDTSKLVLERTEGGVDVARSYASTRDALHVVRKSGGLDGNGSGHAATLSECLWVGSGW